jgi:hypothetical protein
VPGYLNNFLNALPVALPVARLVIRLPGLPLNIADRSPSSFAMVYKMLLVLLMLTVYIPPLNYTCIITNVAYKAPGGF